MAEHRTANSDEWLAARQELLDAEKEHMRRGDELAHRRQELPWVPIEKEYVFETEEGKAVLTELFDGRSQLLVYHLMFGPEDSEPCIGCSFTADNLDGAVFHLAHHDVTFVAVSRAPFENLDAYRRRSGWSFPWVSALGSDFNLDFSLFTEEERRTGKGFNFGTARVAHLDLRDTELHGLSAFALEDDVVYHTYSCYDRGTDVLTATWQLLDRAPKGRDSGAEDWPRRRADEKPAAAMSAAPPTTSRTDHSQ
jgi:predicted dithiol-disulfide oxidoreductase (DUF899 family)